MSMPGLHRLPGTNSEDPMSKYEALWILYGMSSACLRTDIALSRRLSDIANSLSSGDKTLQEVVDEMHWRVSVKT